VYGQLVVSLEQRRVKEVMTMRLLCPAVFPQLRHILIPLCGHYSVYMHIVCVYLDRHNLFDLLLYVYLDTDSYSRTHKNHLVISK